MASPPLSSAGGMASVAHFLMNGVNQANTEFICRLVDSGGGGSVINYCRFPVALAIAAHDDYDLLHVHVASRGSTLRKALLAKAAARRGIPYVIHLHGAGYADFLDELPLSNLEAVRHFFARASFIVVLGSRWLELITCRLGIPSERIRVVHNGVPQSASPSPNRGVPPSILFLGVVNERKGADVLLEALATVLCEAEGRAWHASLVGPTPEATITARARELAHATNRRVHLTGPLFGVDKKWVLEQSSIYCLPSRAEALPMAILEAMSASLPCICTDVGSVREIFGDEATLLPAGDVDALVDALRRVMSDKELREKLGCDAYSRWKNGFTVENMVRGIESVWREVLSADR